MKNTIACVCAAILLLGCGGGGGGNDNSYPVDIPVDCSSGKVPLQVVSHSLQGHVLILNVTYSGGCGTHRFSVWWDGAFLSSHPGIAPIQLHHYADGETCDSTVTDQIVIDMSALDPGLGTSTTHVDLYSAWASGTLIPRFDYSPPAGVAPVPQGSIPITLDCGGPWTG